MPLLSSSILSPSILEPSVLRNSIMGTGVSASPSGEATLLADFFNRQYRTGNDASVSSFSDLITHSRSGNATMTDGYGDELVTNGGFDSDSDWTKGGAWTITNGVAFLPSGTSSILSQSLSTTADKMYEVTFNVSAISTGWFLGVRLGSGSNQTSFTTEGPKTVYLQDEGDGILRFASGVSGSFTIDNVSVREMPVLKWAPHNLLNYSEDLTQTSIYVDFGSTGFVTFDNADTITFDAQTSAQAANITLSSSNLVGQIITGVVELSSQTDAGETVNVKLNWRGGSSVGTQYTLTTTPTFVEITALVPNGTLGIDLIISNAGSGTAKTFTASKWHLYRSDLGGMAANPDQPPSRASYVPTTSTAVYLPRVGHHVFNGNAFVNEGLLAESEARTNLLTYSNDFTNAAWTGTNTGTLALDAVGPDGQENSAATLIDSNSGGTGVVLVEDTVTVSTSTAYTFSVYAKKDQLNSVMLYHASFTTPANNGWIFNLEDGTFSEYSSSPASTPTIENVGNGWYRCAVTFTTDATDNVGICRIYATDGTNITPDLDGTSSVLIYGAQFEQGSTPSSLILTSGSTVTRAAETFTIPSANLPWPSPDYIGSELVTNGTFDTDVSGWTGNFAGVTLSVDNQRLKIAVSGAASGYAFQEVPTVAGKVYSLKVDKTDGTNTAWGVLVESTIWLQGPSSTDADGSYEYYFVASDSSTNLRVYGYGDGTHVFYDNVSVREINPLSVSIAMDGAATFADEDDFNTVVFSKWELDGNNSLRLRIDTESTRTGRVQAVHRASGTENNSGSSNNYFAPDILIPYDIAARFGSTFSQGAESGEAFNVNTGATELPDLSSSDLNLAHDYMGTVGTFRVWDRDIGDAGLVEVTSPSFEPTLSLEFTAEADTSFVVYDWSE